mmetsp:Transcript_22205/g.73085  ORF Transcript_22205/g.73085 Transcript_22205/m.73085 type:complete len:108 (-) Transcript_22205:72-395(-)
MCKLAAGQLVTCSVSGCRIKFHLYCALSCRLRERRKGFACWKHSSEEEEVYCICRQGYEEGEFMIECDHCKEWFHGSCVGVEEEAAEEWETWTCDKCRATAEPDELA